jgi:hypothetical protein
MTEKSRGMIELAVMLPDGKLATMLWPENMPLPSTFVLKPTPGDPGVYDIVTERGVPRP